MKLVVAGDSAGEGLARILEEHLAREHDVVNMSRNTQRPDEFYAELSERVANAVIAGDCDRAILVCGTGIGVCMSANKVPGIRAAHCHDTYSASRATLSNNAQILTMGARVIGPELGKAIVDEFLRHTFDPDGRSAGNVQAIDSLDTRYHASSN